ncbi:protein kinase [Cohnella sp. CFH 77786]|uniref:serine/threonine protein kinase n=1 Tax=Cohnella sp. CFH 77786 TaxID=2662265 RepID=UPI001C60F05D|nr:lipopolysaccharide kinase InaA family protein [Cohnella sp. CFH 77786]MBW5445808.1 protein kinase [Cohnella sp. CFH 77786]
MSLNALFSAHLEKNYRIVNLNPYLDSQAHHGFYYYEGIDAADGKRVFIKVDGTSGEATRREAVIVNQLAGDHFPRLVAYEDKPPFPFLALEWIEGMTLSTLLENRDSLTRRQKQTLLKQLCSILATLHEAGYIHRDIRPDNLMIDMREEDWKLVLIDYSYSMKLGPGAWPELEFLRERPYLLIDLGGAANKPAPLIWDDAYSVRGVALQIDADCERNFPDIWHHLTTWIGKFIYVSNT